MSNFTLYAQGPDDSSTYTECWGKFASSDGRKINSANSLRGLIPAVEKLGHDNFVIVGMGRRISTKKEFFACPTVAATIKRHAND